jgi:threonine/homoserine/homoserine lactone efflux protein
MLPEFMRFALCSMLCIIAPGPDNLSVMAYGISRGRQAGMLFGAGCATGCLLHTVWLCVGVSALIAASATAFAWLKVAGAGYLFYLAYRAFRGGALGGQSGTAVTGSHGGIPGGTVFFRRGFLANALNPKVALFFLAFVPQFTGPGMMPMWLELFSLGLVFALLTLVMFGVIGYYSARAGEFLKRHPRFGVWTDRLTGLMFVALGVTLLFAEIHRNP